MSSSNTPTALPSTEHDLLLDELEVFKVQDHPDNSGRKILRIIGKFFPARVLNGAEGEEVLKKYLERRIFPEIGETPFCIVYVHTCVHRPDNFPGVFFLRSIYESLPAAVRDSLETVYFVHPGLCARLFFATFGRFLFSAGLYGKLSYVSRLEFLGEYLRRFDIEMPEFVYDHDDELEQLPLMDYGLKSRRYNRDFDAAAMDSVASMYSLRNIS